MTDKILMPCLGTVVEQGIILFWHKKVGDSFKKGESLLEITVDKATYVIESESEGTLLQVCAVEGDLVPSGAVIAVAGNANDKIPQEFCEIKYPKAMLDSCMLYRKKLDGPVSGVVSEPLSAMRKVISDRMIQSKDNAPHFYVTTSVDMSECVELRKRLKSEKIRATYNDMIIKAAALALRKYPAVASVYTPEGYIQREEMHVGFAVAIEPDGLEVPVIRNADKVSLGEISEKSKELAEKARNKKLLPDDFSGSVFTVSNLGSFDVDSFTAIINPGESAILAVGKMKDTPVVVKGEIEIKPMMNIVISSDHRTIDGVLAARFNAYVKSLLESPQKLT